MAIFEKRIMAATCLLLVAGCVTDELVVYQKSVVSNEAAKRFLGEYEVKVWAGEAKPDSVNVTETDGDLGFSYSLPDRKVKLKFVLSEIPNAKKGLYLLSIPAQADTNQANMFFIGEADKDHTRIWAVFSNLPVAKDHLGFQDGKAKAEDVKAFLATHADAFVTANQPQITLTNPKK